MLQKGLQFAKCLGIVSVRMGLDRFVDGANKQQIAIAGRQGFSLVELLIVMGIIAHLVGILIPVVSRVQAASRSITCISTLRNIGHAFRLYAQDNKMTLPDPGSVGYSWEQLLQPYFHAEFRCPSDEEVYPSVGSSYDWRDTPDASTTLAGARWLRSSGRIWSWRLNRFPAGTGRG